jgi:hypothetical protein
MNLKEEEKLEREARLRWPRMANRAMARKLTKGDALCIFAEGGTLLEDGDYLLPRFVEDMDYCDTRREVWIWSIGRNLSDGRIVASTDTKYYLNPLWECLFLR